MQPSESMVKRDWTMAGVGLVVVSVVSYAAVRLSLDDVAGATRRPNGSCCDTEFVHGWVWPWMLAIALPIFVIARWQPVLGLLAAAIASYASFHIVSVGIDRYLDSGWGDGLEILGYIGSAVHAFAFALAAGLGYVWWRRRRSKHAQLLRPEQ